MTLRIVDSAAQLDRALTHLEAAFAAWAAVADDRWTALDAAGALWTGASYATRWDCYLYVERSAAAAAIGVALSGDEDLLRLELDSAAPARARRRGALALDSREAPYLLFSRDALALFGVRDPLGRLQDAPGVRPAVVAEREFVLIGPFLEGQGPDALVALAALTPTFELALERRARPSAFPSALPSAQSFEGPSPIPMDPPPRGRRAAGRAAAAAARVLAEHGWALAPLEGGFSAHRGEARLTAQVCARLEAASVHSAVGALALAPSGPKLLLLPQPRDPERLSSIVQRLAPLGVRAVVFAWEDGALTLRSAAPLLGAGFDVAALFG